MLGLIHLATKASTLRLESDDAQIAFGPNKECIIQLDGDALTSSCEITEPPSFAGALLAEQNILRTTNQNGQLSENLKFNDDGTADFKNQVAFGVSFESLKEIAEIDNLNSEWTIQMDLKGANTADNAYCRVYHNVNTVAWSWGDGDSTGEHGQQPVYFWKQNENLNGAANWNNWKVLQCVDDEDISDTYECKLAEKGYGMTTFVDPNFDNAKMLSLRTQRRADQYIEFTLLGAESTSASEGTKVLWRGEGKGTQNFNYAFDGGSGDSPDKVAPMTLYCTGVTGRVYSIKRIA
jgi:hypothetical protein